MAGLCKGTANQKLPTATSLVPIAELKGLSIDTITPNIKSPPELDLAKTSIVDCTTPAGARPTTKADFLVSARKFKPGHEAEIVSFFHGIRVEEARKMGRPEREYKSPTEPWFLFNSRSNF